MKDDLKSCIISESNTLVPSVETAQREAETRNAAKRQAERQAKMDAWQDPEAMAYRKAVHEKGAIESLWFLRSLGQCAEDRDVPIPPDSELPAHMRGQQPSTVRAYLRGSKEWSAKVKAQREADEAKAKTREQYPELFGIDFSAVRRETVVGDEHKVRDGKTLTVKEHPTATLEERIRIALRIQGEETYTILPRDKPKKGAIARFFAGIKGAFEDL